MVEVSATGVFMWGLSTGVALAAAASLLKDSLAQSPSKTPPKSSPTTTSTTTTTTTNGAPIDDADAAENDVDAAAISDADANNITAIAYHPLFPSGHAPASSSAILPKLDAQLTISSSRLQQIVLHMISEIKKGLVQDGEKFKMIPSYVVKRPTGAEVGTFLALDLGGSNFRVCQLLLESQGRVRTTQRKYVISEALKAGPGIQLFDFFAECVAKFLIEIGADPDTNTNLGFTFSFPIQQTSINRGTLMQWNKGFECSGVLGQDVVQLLQDAFVRKHLSITVTALVNDTVGTLMAHAYSDPQTYVGVILGTGTNAAYVERLEDVPKWKGERKGEMIINTEWGAYDEPTVLQISKYDQLLDRFSANPKSQIFEKMISGMYLGEIVRLIIVDLVSSGELFHGRSSTELSKSYNFDTAYMSRIERDHSLELSDTKNLFEDLLGIPATTLQDRRIVKHICELVGTRAARLSAAGIAAVVTKINRLDACTVAIDGSLFEHYPHFGNRMRDALREILGITAENIILEQARDGSGQGAALIAALH